MKIICHQPELAAHISAVVRVVPTKPSHPVLGNILINAYGGQVSLTGFDLSVGLVVSFQAEVPRPGSICLPSKLLNDIVSKLPPEDITIDVSEHIAIIKCSTGEYEMMGMPVADYPELPTVEEAKKLAIDPVLIELGIKGALPSASTDETKLVLNGVHVCTTAKGIEFAATDGHRLSVFAHPMDDGGDMDIEGLIIPSKAVKEIERIMGSSNSDEAISIAFDGSQISLEYGDQRMISRLIDGQYPQYNQLIPKAFDRTVVVNRKALIGALDRVAIVANQKNSVVKFSLADGLITISAEAPDVGKAQETVAATLQGEPLELAFNVKYIQDGLKAGMDTEQVTMLCNTPTTPVVFKPVNGGDMTYLVMPVQIRQD